MAAKDAAAIGDLYCEDMVVWHAFDGESHSKAQNLRYLSEVFFPLFSSLYFADVKRQLTDTGYVQQHVLKGELFNNRSLVMPCCFVIEVYEGKLRRLDEYLDPRPFLLATGSV